MFVDMVYIYYYSHYCIYEINFYYVFINPNQNFYIIYS